MITNRKITREGMKESELDEESKLALRAMRRASRQVTKLYRQHSLEIITTDKDGKMISVKP